MSVLEELEDIRKRVQESERTRAKREADIALLQEKCSEDMARLRELGAESLDQAIDLVARKEKDLQEKVRSIKAKLEAV